MKTTMLALTAATTLLFGCATGERVPGDDDRVVSTGAETNEDDPMRTGDCDDAFQAIADVEPPQDRTGQIDMAINICNSVEDWQDAAEAHPDALGDRDPMEVLRSRCDDDAQAEVPLCQALDES